MRSTRRIDPPATRRARATLAAVAALAIVAGAATTARAASMLDFDVWMRAIDRRSVDVQRHIDARRTDAAVADARELARLYGLMAAYFADDAHVADAVEMSRSGQALAAAIPGALAAQDYDGASRAAVDLAHACNDCHDVHKPFP
ncbi:MAG: hypothetical protein JF586_08600 [Burkholderiales bacterium]|jgi:hypothetical protein|nr:hypothetical protein [Burkholderiales bacterium]